MQPSLDDIQQCLNRCVQRMLEVSRGVTKWVPPSNDPEHGKITAQSTEKYDATNSCSGAKQTFTAISYYTAYSVSFILCFFI